MKKAITNYLIFFLILVTTSAQAQTNSSGIDTGLEETVSLLEKSFPFVELYIIAIQDNQLVLEASKDTELQPNMELSAFRQGKEFTHPITGITLGYFEKTLGIIGITDINQDNILAKSLKIKAGETIKRGDKARITAGKIKLAFWKLSNSHTQAIDTQKLQQQLTYHLETSERFTIISQNEALQTLGKSATDNNQEVPSKKDLEQLTEKLNVMGLLIAQVKELENVIWLETKIISTTSGTLIAKTKVQLQPTISGQEPSHK